MPDLPAALKLPSVSSAPPVPAALLLPQPGGKFLYGKPVDEAAGGGGNFVLFDTEDPTARFTEVITYFGPDTGGTEDEYRGAFEPEWQSPDVTWGSDNLFLHAKGFNGLSPGVAHILTALAPIAPDTGSEYNDFSATTFHTNGIGIDEWAYSGYQANVFFAVRFRNASGTEQVARSVESIVTGMYTEDPVPGSFDLSTLSFVSFPVGDYFTETSVPTSDGAFIDSLTVESVLSICEKAHDINFHNACRWANRRANFNEALLPVAQKGQKLQQTLGSSVPNVPLSSENL